MKLNIVYIFLMAVLITSSAMGKLSSVSFIISKIVAGLIVILFILKYKDLKFFYPKILNYYVLFIIWCAISAPFVGANLEIVYLRLLTPIQIVIFFIVSYNLARNEKNFNKLSIILFISVCVLMLGPLTGLPIGNPYETERYQGFTHNPNVLGLYINYLLISLFYFVIRGKNKLISNVFYLSIFIIALYFIIQSGSRTSLALFISITIGFILFLAKSFKKLAGILFVLSIITLIFSNIIISYILESPLFYRIDNEGVMENSATIRVLNVINAWKVFLSHPIAGVGLDNFRFYNPIGNAAHNYFLEVLASTGIVGFIILFLFYYRLSNLSYKTFRIKSLRSESVYSILFLIITFVYSFGFHLYESMEHFIIISIIYSVLLNSNYEKDRDYSTA